MVRLGDQHQGSLQPSCSAGHSNDPHPNRSISYSNAVVNLRSILDQLGYDGAKYSEHSSRRGVATRSAEIGIADDEIQVAGGWKDPRTVRLYIDRHPKQTQRLTRKIFDTNE